MTDKKEIKPRKNGGADNRAQNKGNNPEVFPPEAVAAWERLAQICNLSAVAEIVDSNHETVRRWGKDGKGMPERYVDKFVEATAIPLEIVRPDIAAKRKAEEPTPKEVRAKERAEAAKA